MPTYQYRCTDCGTDLEAVQKFTDPTLTECPTCHGSLRKVFNAVGVVFKGSGFYRTDSRPKEGSSSGSTSSSGNESKGKDGSSNGSSEKSGSSDKKSDTKSSDTGSTSGAANGSGSSDTKTPSKASSSASTGSSSSS